MFKMMMELEITIRQSGRWGKWWLPVHGLNSCFWNHRLYKNRTLWEL